MTERIARLTTEQVFQLARATLETVLHRRKVQRLLKKGPVPVAIDEHQIPTWKNKVRTRKDGADRTRVPDERAKDDAKYLIGSALHEGTDQAFSLMTLEIVVDGLRLTLAVAPVTRFVNREKLVLSLLEAASQFARIEVVLLDRGFWSAALLDGLDRAGYRYLMPAVRSERMKELLGEVQHLMRWVGPWTIESTEGTRKASMTLTIQDTPRKKRQRSEERRLLLATNRPVTGEELRSLAARYDGRWGIETGYRIKEYDFWIRTRTRVVATRFFLWLFQFLLYDLWVLTNMLRERRGHAAVGEPLTAAQFHRKLLVVLGVFQVRRPAR